MSFRNQLEHLHLTTSKRLQRAPRGEGVTDRCLESAYGRFQNDVFSTGPYCRASLTANEIADENYQRHGRPYFAQYLQRASRIKLAE